MVSRKAYEWFIYIPEEGDWPIHYSGPSAKEARLAYLRWAGRKRCPDGSKIWFREYPVTIDRFRNQDTVALGYRGYDIRLFFEGKKHTTAIFLNNERVDISDHDPENEPTEIFDIDDIRQWIDEDIRCRKERIE
jgi:hypothetical protein